MTQDQINTEAFIDLEVLLNTKEIERLFQAIRCPSGRGKVKKTFEWDGKQYTISGKNGYRGSKIKIASSDGRELDLNIDIITFSGSTLEGFVFRDISVDYEFGYFLPDGSRLVRSTTEGVEINGPQEYILKKIDLEGNTKLLNGYLLPAGVTITPDGIKDGDTLVSEEADRIIDEPIKSINGHYDAEPIVSISLKDIRSIKDGDSKKADAKQAELITKLRNVLEEEFKKRVEQRRESVDFELRKVGQMLADKDALISQIYDSAFTQDEIKMFINCLEEKEIRDGFQTR